MKSILQFILILAVAAGAPIAVAAGGGKVGKTIVAFKDKDPTIDKRFAKAHGFAIFPSVGKGAFIVGAGGGKGEVFERGKLIGTTQMTQFTIGAQIGGQAYSEVIFFEHKTVFDHFTSGQFEFAAGVSAVAVRKGGSDAVDYRDGVAVFTMSEKGLMLEAAIGGQKFSFKPN